MNDLDRLMRAVLEDPADDLPRLVMADWLEENSTCFENRVIRDPLAYARFIRLQIEIHREQPGYELDPVKLGSVLTSERDRVRQIYTHWKAWRLFCDAGFSDPNWNNIARRHATWQRGMPCRVTEARMIRSEEHLKNLFLNWPITELDFEYHVQPRRYRYQGAYRWRWYRNCLYQIQPISHLLSRSFLDRSYDSFEMADAALSDELVRIGRELAGLPVLHTLTSPA